MLSIAEELLTASFALDVSGLNLFADFIADDAIDVMEFCALNWVTVSEKMLSLSLGDLTTKY
jgi:hypothetical protein